MKLKFITTNEGKFSEFNDALSGADVNLERLNMSYPEIQAESLEGVIAFGMQWLDKKVHGPYVIDDSGLFISELNGFPGVYSAFAFRALGNAGILRLMGGMRNRKAIFRTVIGLSINGHHSTLDGECEGTITATERGESGFGFDPIFRPSDSTMTFAEMNIGEKNALSHRGAALRKLKNTLLSSPLR